MVGDDFFDSLIELVAVNHDDVSAPKALHLYIRAYTHDLESLASGGAWMRFLELDLIKESVFWDYQSLSSMCKFVSFFIT